MLASQACSFTVDPRSSTLAFDAASTLHPVHGKASDLMGTVTAALSDGALALDPMPAMRISVPVEKLVSGNAMQDRQMWKLLDSKRSPAIVATLTNLESTGGSGYRAKGEIALNGRARRYEGDLSIATEGKRITVDGSLIVDIRDFGIQPPRLLMITVEPEVTVTLHLVADSSEVSS